MPATSALVLLKWMFHKLICIEQSTSLRYLWATYMVNKAKVSINKGVEEILLPLKPTVFLPHMALIASLCFALPDRVGVICLSN